MKHVLKIALVAAAASAIAAPALAQSSASQSTDATVKIVQPITLTKNSDLAFGTVIRPASGSSTITISNASDTPTVTGGTAAVSGTASRASFTVGGEGGQTFSISVPASVTMTRSGGSETLSVTLTASGSSGTLSGSFGSAGSATFTVGGAFTVASTDVSGDYSGSFNTTVAYN